jgi:hypothetical protein
MQLFLAEKLDRKGPPIALSHDDWHEYCPRRVSTLANARFAGSGCAVAKWGTILHGGIFSAQKSWLGNLIDIIDSLKLVYSPYRAAIPAIEKMSKGL